MAIPTPLLQHPGSTGRRTRLRFTRPERRFASLEALRVFFHGHFCKFQHDEGQWPCIKCRGRGFEFHDYHRHVCEPCNGSGKGSKGPIEAIYRQDTKEWKEKLAIWKAKQSILDGINLTRTQRRILVQLVDELRTETT